MTNVIDVINIEIYDVPKWLMPFLRRGTITLFDVTYGSQNTHSYKSDVHYKFLDLRYQIKKLVDAVRLGRFGIGKYLALKFGRFDSDNYGEWATWCGITFSTCWWDDIYPDIVTFRLFGRRFYIKDPEFVCNPEVDGQID